MAPTANRADLLDAQWTNLYLAALALGLLALWIGSHRTKRRFLGQHLVAVAGFVLRTAIATTTLWAIFQALARGIVLASPWSLWLTASISGLAIEIAIALHQHERNIVRREHARLIISLRIAAIATLTVILLQPVFAHQSQCRLPREIAILLDDSASMHIVDNQSSPSEKLKIAALFGIGAAGRNSTLTDVQRGLQLLESQLAAEARVLEPPPGVSDAAANSLISRRIAPLQALLEDARKRMGDLVQITRRARGNVTGAETRLLENLEDRIANNITSALAEASIQLASANYHRTIAEIQDTERQISYVLENLPVIIEASDQRFYNSLSAVERAEIDTTAATTRSAIARQALLRNQFVQELGTDYHLRFIRFGQRPESIDGQSWLNTGHPSPIPDEQSAFRRSTDLTSALESVLAQIPSGSLAGVLVLSDGRHNGPRTIEEVAHRLGVQGAPVGAVVIGSSISPKDACIVAVRVPETIYVDDRAIIQADLKLDGLSGETITISLLNDGDLLETREINVREDTLRTTVRFAHTPDAIGISSYTVTASPTTGESFLANNRWDFALAVTDDRTNVLIVESYPRWEFRYLRNLFHARDKSVHLQFVLLHPDEIADAQPPAEIPASADRKFGDSEATSLPIGREQWRKFDAIILGDIPPNAIDETVWGHIRHCVAERAALLITVAGPRFMPHAFDSPTLKELLPVTYAESDEMLTSGPEPSYRLRLTPEGRNSPILQQSLDPKLNEMIWGSLPPLHWRSPITGLKPGAEALAYAHPIGSSETRTPSHELQSANAIIAAQRYASGKIVAINFDRTWRLRYGVGDVYHHKFWGQLLRWGTGEILRAGNRFVRLGTDKLSYQPDETVHVTARLTTPEHRPLTAGKVSISIYQHDQPVLRKALTFRPDSNGIYETQIPRLPGQGRFRIRLEGEDVSRILLGQNAGQVETEFLVEASRNAIELSELTADPNLLGRVAALSGGSIADPDDAAALRKFFAPPGQIIRERKETTLWDNFPLLLVFFALLSSEWITRRKAGLA